MKKIISLILVIAIALLVACAETTEADTQNDYIQDSNFSIYEDKKTGVNYIVYNRYKYGGMTVRLNADGTPYVSEVE
jgi:outer membrane biogenesis lipoprotein LolB